MKPTDAQERAREAINAFRRMLPNLNGYARAITGNRKIVIVPSMGTNGGTDGKTIYMRPPIKLGDKTPHDKQLCDKVDSNMLQRCEACRIREGVLATIYHEIAHIAYDSFSPVRPEDAAKFTVQAADELGTKYAKAVVKRVEEMASLNKIDYMRLAMELSPFLHMILNCLEDARINARMGEARPGVRRMMQGQLNEVMAEGVEVPGPRGQVVMEHWRDRPTNAQVMIGLFFKSSHYDYSTWLSDEVVRVLDDKVITDLCEQVYEAKGASETYALAIKALARLRELGYCRSDKDPEEEEEEDEDEAGSPEAGEEAQDDTPPEADSDSESEAPEDDSQPLDDEGSGDSSGNAGSDSTPGDAEASGSGDDLDADAEEPTEEPAGGWEDGAEGEPDTPGDDAQPDEEDRLGSGDGGSEEEMDHGGSDQEGSDADDAGSRDSEGEIGDGAGGDQVGDEAEPGESGGPGDLHHDPEGGVPGPEGGDPGEDVSEDDSATGDDTGTPSGSGAGGSGATDGSSPTDSHDTGTEENLGTGDIHEFIDDLARILGHQEGYETGTDGHLEEFADLNETAAEEKAIEVAVVQAEYFDDFSGNIGGASVHKRGGDEGDAWKYADDPRYRIQFGADDCMPPESVLGPALLRMRVTFSENKRAHETRHLKAGRVNARALGKRAWGDDERLFKRKIQPNKRDYSVVIGMDISGSTAGSDILAVEKKAVMAQAELLNRIGVRFEVWAHTGGWGDGLSGMSLQMYSIKEFDEPWTNRTRDNLKEIHPVHANLDGHTLEFYRKRIDRETTTDRVIMYYTDGAMPLENGREELEILQREIALCKRKGYTLLGVGIRNDDPVKHGLDTVRVDSDEDVIKVVRHLEKRLER